VEVTTAELSRSGNGEIYIAGDMHYGALTCSRSSIRQMIGDLSKKRNAQLCLVGDQIEAITPEDKRWQTTSVAWRDLLITPELQAQALVQDLKPMKGRIPALLTGNHEWKLMNIANFPDQMASALDSFYGSSACVVHFTWKGNTVFRFFLAHGSWTPASQAKDVVQADANMRAMLKLKLQDQVGDCVGMFCGHGHRLLIQPPTAQNHLYITTTRDGSVNQNYKVSPDQSADYLHPDTRWYGMSGSFRKLYSPPGSKAVGYGEMKLYRPTEIGCLKAVIKAGRLEYVQKVVY
jgi:hypothetical protein